MARYAAYNSDVAAPSPVLGWYDTGEFAYENLPKAGDLLEMTDAQWTARMSGQWAVSAGALVAYTPPAPAVDSRVAAQAALDRSDMTALRCFKAGVAFPPTWQVYVIELRAIVAGGPSSAALPTQPAYPTGT